MDTFFADRTDRGLNVRTAVSRKSAFLVSVSPAIQILALLAYVGDFGESRHHMYTVNNTIISYVGHVGAPLRFKTMEKVHISFFTVCGILFYLLEQEVPWNFSFITVVG